MKGAHIAAWNMEIDFDCQQIQKSTFFLSLWFRFRPSTRRRPSSPASSWRGAITPATEHLFPVAQRRRVPRIVCPWRITADRPPISHLVGTGNGVVFGPPRHPLQFWSSRARGAPFIRPFWQPGVRPCLGVAAMSL